MAAPRLLPASPLSLPRLLRPEGVSSHVPAVPVHAAGGRVPTRQVPPVASSAQVPGTGTGGWVLTPSPSRRRPSPRGPTPLRPVERWALPVWNRRCSHVVVPSGSRLRGERPPGRRTFSHLGSLTPAASTTRSLQCWEPHARVSVPAPLHRGGSGAQPGTACGAPATGGARRTRSGRGGACLLSAPAVPPGPRPGPGADAGAGTMLRRGRCGTEVRLVKQDVPATWGSAGQRASPGLRCDTRSRPVCVAQSQWGKAVGFSVKINKAKPGVPPRPAGPCGATRSCGARQGTEGGAAPTAGPVAPAGWAGGPRRAPPSGRPAGGSVGVGGDAALVPGRCPQNCELQGRQGAAPPAGGRAPRAGGPSERGTRTPCSGQRPAPAVGTSASRRPRPRGAVRQQSDCATSPRRATPT